MPAKFILLIILLGFAFYLPITAFKQDIVHDQHIDHVWHDFEPDKISNYVNDGKIVIVDITADWCLMCKVNKLAVLNREDILAKLNDKNIIAMRKKMINYDIDTINYIKSFNRHGLPFDIVFGPKAPSGILLPEILTKKSLINAISQAK